MSVQAFNSRDNAMAQQAGKAVSVEERIDSLLKGAVDPHVHSGPSIAPRAVDHLELLRPVGRRLRRGGDQGPRLQRCDDRRPDQEASSGPAHQALFQHRAEQCGRRIQSLRRRAHGGDGRQGRVVADPGGGKPPALGENVELGAPGFHPEDAARPSASLFSTVRGGAGRRQGNPRYRGQERHGAGERPPACERDLASVRRGQTSRRQADRPYPSRGHCRRHHE